jgi:DNA-binding LytR/AlgR family response regulator
VDGRLANDGMELANRARQMRPTLSVLLTSGYPPKAIEATDIEFIAKPYLIEELARRILALADRRSG